MRGDDDLFDLQQWIGSTRYCAISIRSDSSRCAKRGSIRCARRSWRICKRRRAAAESGSTASACRNGPRARRRHRSKRRSNRTTTVSKRRSSAGRGSPASTGDVLRAMCRRNTPPSMLSPCDRTMGAGQRGALRHRGDRRLRRGGERMEQGHGALPRGRRYGDPVRPVAAGRGRHRPATLRAARPQRVYDVE